MPLFQVLFAMVLLQISTFKGFEARANEAIGSSNKLAFMQSYSAKGGSKNFDFSGIVSLSGCSGSLVRYDDSVDSDRALVLTNGHCVGSINPGEIYSNQPSTKSFKILDAQSAVLGVVRAQRLLYATMTKTDIGIYQLRETYDNISQRFGVEALVLSRDFAGVGESIEIISGFWKRGYSCEIEKIVPMLKEGRWITEDSIRYSQTGCAMIGGTSGSPILLAGTKIVVGIHNTGNDEGEMCTSNNPCEISKDGSIEYRKGFNYGQQTSWIYQCRNDSRVFDINAPQCELPAGLTTSM